LEGFFEAFGSKIVVQLKATVRSNKDALSPASTDPSLRSAVKRNHQIW
jgi:hypothetical protein